MDEQLEIEVILADIASCLILMAFSIQSHRMHFNFGLYSSVLLAFFLHGLVFSILLLNKAIRSETKSDRWLSLFTFLAVLYITPFMLGYAGWYTRQPYRDILFYIPFQQNLLLPPVLYFYIRTLLDQSFSFSRKDWIHFIPAALYLGYSLLVFLADKLILGEYYFYSDGQDKDLATWYQVAGVLFLGFYLVKSLILYQRYQAISYNMLSFADTVMLRWARRFLTAFLLLLSIRCILFIYNPEWDSFGKKFWYYLGFSMLVYYISVSGLLNTVQSHTSLKDAKQEDEEKENEEEKGTPYTGPTASELPGLLLWKEKIADIMETEKLYENPELTLTELSDHTGLHSKKLSRIINQGFGMNFNDLVNHYRSQAVIKMIDNGEHTLQTLLGIAFESGFNSKSTFNRAFKKYSGLTPKEYIAKRRSK